MLGTWSRRFAGKENSRNGHRCNCHQTPANDDDARLVHEVSQLLAPASHSAARVGGSPALVRNILLDIVTLTLATAEQEGNGSDAYRAVRNALVGIRDNPNLRTDVSPPPISPERRDDVAPLTPRTARRGLGATGAVQIPDGMWNRHAPTNWAWVAASTPLVGATQGKAVTTLAHKMAEDGLLTRLPNAPPSECAGVRKAQIGHKGSVHREARLVIGMSRLPTEKLRQPTLEQLGAAMSLMRHLGLRVYFTKLDISNMFYTCRTPPGRDSDIRVQIGDDIYGFPELPFG